MFKRTQLIRGVLLVAIFGAFSFSTVETSHGQDGLAERIGQQIDRGLDRLGNEIRQNWNSLRQFVDKLGVQGRVYARLRWDKDLEQSKLEVDVTEDGVVTLRGQVANELAKQKAVKLASDTIGVVEVKENLQVPGG